MSLPTQDVRSPALPYQGLLEVSESITRHADLAELLHDLARRLRPVVPFDFISLMLHDDDKDVMRLHILESERPQQVYHAPDAVPDESPGVVVWRTQQPMLIADFEQETRYPDMAPVWRGLGMRSGYYLPLTTAQRRLGTIHFASAAPRRYAPADAERDHILSMLRQTNWVIGGPSGAAARLGLKRTTLQSKMQKLGIMRPG